MSTRRHFLQSTFAVATAMPVFAAPAPETTPAPLLHPLRGLKPGATIHYRTVTAAVAFPNQYSMKRGESAKSEVFSFVQPGPAATAKVAVWNDTHQQADTLATVHQLTEEFKPAALVWNGDIVADQFMQEGDFADTVLQPGNDLALAASRPLIYVRGNHDVRGAVARDLPRFLPKAVLDGYQNIVRVGPLAIGVQAVISGHTHEFWHDAPTADRPFHQITGGGPKNSVDGWSKSPATVITLTASYGFLYTCRLPLSVVKKPLIDEGLFDAATLGQVGSTFALGYAAGKLVGGALADHANVRKLFALRVLVSALVNLLIPLSLTP